MEELNLENEIFTKKDIGDVINILVDLMNVLPKKKLNNGQNQNFVLEDFEKYLTKLLTKNVLKTREERAAVTKFLYKIQSRREAIALMNGEIDMEEIKKSAESLGRKWTIPENEPFGISVSKR